jgi:hypothetical protein
LYRVAEVISTFAVRGEDIIVMGEDDMLYVLTGTKNPRYLLFPFHPYNGKLHGVLKREFFNLRNTVNKTNPVYIVARELDNLTERGFIEIGDIIRQRYVQVANIEGTLIYLRRDRLRSIFVQ